MKIKALISFGVTAKLICVFVFAYANCWFSHEAAHLGEFMFSAEKLIFGRLAQLTCLISCLGPFQQLGSYGDRPSSSKTGEVILCLVH